ncbi:MAG: hypothetical protein HRT57_00220 [Crocinitomicaceae bacterium]|nr:hypothetical protein [Crocinitomicaceae bacterium]
MLFLLCATTAFSQSIDEEKIWLRIKFLANNALVTEDYKSATFYFLKGESECDNFGSINYARLTESLIRVIRMEKDEVVKEAYLDTLIQVWNRMDEKGFYDHKTDLLRGYYYTDLTTPDRNKADFYFRRGIEEKETPINENYILPYFNNTFELYKKEQDLDKKAKLKSQLINDFFALSDLVLESDYHYLTLENLTKQMKSVIHNCKDITSEIEGFIDALPTDSEKAKALVTNWINLMEHEKCTKSKEYEILKDKLEKLNSESSKGL